MSATDHDQLLAEARSRLREGIAADPQDAIDQLLDEGLATALEVNALLAELRPGRRARCCGIRFEHGALTSARPCADCPDVP